MNAGCHVLREDNTAEAARAFQAAYQLAPTDVEIVNKFGYAYLRHHDPEASETWLLSHWFWRRSPRMRVGEPAVDYAKQGQAQHARRLFGEWLASSHNQTAQFFA